MKLGRIFLWGLTMALLSRIVLVGISVLMAYMAGVGSATLTVTTVYWVFVLIAIVVAMCLQVRDGKNPPSPYSHLTAGLLAVFLGSVGAHKFYCRKYTWAIVFVLFAGTGVPFVAGLIEGVIYLLMDDDRFNRSIRGTSF